MAVMAVGGDMDVDLGGELDDEPGGELFVGCGQTPLLPLQPIHSLTPFPLSPLPPHSSPPPVLLPAKQLRELDLSGNAITVVPASVAQCVLLEYLGLGKNAITAIPVELYTACVKLRDLYVSAGCFRVYCSSTTAIRLKHNARILHDVNTLLPLTLLPT
jgi:hypothetical protein